MNPERLSAHCARVIEAPGAIRRLHRFILDCAARGKLVEREIEVLSIVGLAGPAAARRQMGDGIGGKQSPMAGGGR